MITTIQLNENVKRALDRMKSNKETYEEVIIALIDNANSRKKEKEELLKEEALEFYDESLKIEKEFECTLMDGLDKNEKW
jgi:predicted CopG family antitoxin